MRVNIQMKIAHRLIGRILREYPNENSPRRFIGCSSVTIRMKIAHRFIGGYRTAMKSSSPARDGREVPPNHRPPMQPEHTITIQFCRPLRGLICRRARQIPPINRWAIFGLHRAKSCPTQTSSQAPMPCAFNHLCEYHKSLGAYRGPLARPPLPGVSWLRRGTTAGQNAKSGTGLRDSIPGSSRRAGADRDHD